MRMRRQSDASSQIVLLALVFSVMTVIFHIRENKQEQTLDRISELLNYEPVSKDDSKKPGIIQRLDKIENATVEQTAEVEKPILQPKSKPAKLRKSKPKKTALDYASGDVQVGFLER